MKQDYLLLLILLLLFLTTFEVRGVDYITAYTNTPLDYNQRNSWSPNGIPTLSDNVYINASGSQIYANNQILASSILVSGGLNSYLNISSNFGAYYYLGLDYGATLNLLPNTTANAIITIVSQTSGGNEGWFDIGGTLNVRENTIFFISGYGEVYIYDQGIVKTNGTLINYLVTSNYGLFIVNNGGIYGSLSLFYNYGNVIINNGGYFESDNYLVLNSSSNFVVTGGKMWNNGWKIQNSGMNISSGIVNNVGVSNLIYGSSLVWIDQSTELYFNGSITVYEEANFYLGDSELNMVPSAPGTYLKFTDSSEGLFLNSSLALNNVTIITNNNSYVQISNSWISSDQGFGGYDTSQVVIGNGSLISCNNLFLMDNAYLELGDSRLEIKDQFFGMFNQTILYVVNSRFDIINQNQQVLSALGQFDNSSLLIVNDSIFNLNSFFMIQDTSRFYVRFNSTFNIYQSFMSVNQSVVFFDESTLSIQSYAVFDDDSSLYLRLSTLFVNESVYLGSQAYFQFNSSQINIDGSFIYNQTISKYISEIRDSQVVAKGSFKSYGNLLVENSSIVSYFNFTSFYILESVNSSITVERGLFYAKEQFSAFDTSIVMNNGIILVEANSTFSCENCNITIKEGNFRQNGGSNITLINTVFFNQGGVVESYGKLYVSNSTDFRNQGHFILQNNIEPQDPNSTNNLINTGSFTINGNQTSEIQIGFINSGTIQVDQSITFKTYHQSSGSLELNNGYTVNNNEGTITINGGDLYGNGIINTTLSNNGGRIGSKSTNSIKINGNYSQSSNSEMMLTLEALNNQTLLEILNEASFDGTITIRVNQDIVASDQPLSNSTLVTFNNSTGTFNKVVIVTYNRDTGEETVMNSECQKIKLQSDNSKLSLLVDPSQDSDACNPKSTLQKSKLSKGAIAGVVIGVVAGAAIIGLILYFKSKLYPKMLIVKLKSKLGN